ncbi:MAG: glycerophosphodiester phosphodiesterase [Clostridia bacterium]|nr:glycerophosphodiester phosphodiesterase [Clostridia bacterium]
MSEYSIIAHRGANLYAPQNTLPAFRKALELQADGLETDVHLTKDGEAVICHNYSINETSNGLGKIADRTLKDLKSHDFGRYFSKKFKGTTLPSLDEFLELCKAESLKIMNIELKHPRTKGSLIVEKTLEAVRKHGLIDKLLISSFDEKLLMRAKEIDPECKTAYLYPGPDSAVRCFFKPPYALVKKIGADAVHPNVFFVNKAMVDKFHSMGVKVNVWTVNTEEQIEKMVRCGVDGYITDSPADTREIIERLLKRRKSFNASL